MKYLHTHYKLVLVLISVLLLPFIFKPTDVYAQVTTKYVCFPTCDETDARFLAIAGSGLSNLSGDTITIQFASPGVEPNLEIGIFDGDSESTWDLGDNIPLEYTLYADPGGDLSGTTVIGQWLGDTMPDNAWYTITIPNVPEAMSESGHYFYNMTVRLTNVNLASLSAFKLRVAGTLMIPPQPFSIISSLGSLNDINVVYPNYPDLTETTYDGNWRFYLEVLPGLSELHL